MGTGESGAETEIILRAVVFAHVFLDWGNYTLGGNFHTGTTDAHIIYAEDDNEQTNQANMIHSWAVQLHFGRAM